MFRSSIIGSLLFASIATVPATAGTLCQTRNIPNAATNWNSSLSFQKFDPTLGVLTSISVKLTGNVAGSVHLESTDSSAIAIQTIYEVILTVQRPDLTPIVVVSPGTNFLDNLGPADGTLDFGGPSGTQHLNLMLSENLTVVLPPPASDLALFTGVGNIALPVSAQGNSTAIGSGNLITQFVTAAGASVELCYEYAPDCNQNGVPDAVDIAKRTSTDVNANGVPDECEQGGTEGCSHGYWKNHLSAWGPTGYSPLNSFNTVFGVVAFTPDRTLITALNTGGGGMNNLGRQATAALLSASHPGVDFPLTPQEVIDLTVLSIANGTFAEQAKAFDIMVNLGCPLN